MRPKIAADTPDAITLGTRVQHLTQSSGQAESNSSYNGVTFFSNGLGQSLTWLLGVHFDTVLNPVGVHFCPAVELAHGTHHRFFTMFTGHAGDGKNLLHFISLENTETTKARIVNLVNNIRLYFS
jgi:hypothetical protein